jgi:murein DD-endopeptidase MepM/ murein hydrolase activator NlpD
MDIDVSTLIGRGSGIGLSQPDSADSPERLAEVAREFEAVIIHQLLQQMRAAASWAGEDDADGELFGARLMETIDVELARQIAAGGGLGLAETLFPSQGEPAPQTITDVAEAVRLAYGTSSPDMSVSETASLTAINAGVLAPDRSNGPGLEAGVTSGFGWRKDPIAGTERFHAGIDVRAAYGHEVGAASAGRVVQAGEQGGYGLTVVIEHRSGIQTRYAHLSSILVEEGEGVGARQPIGRAGQTGRATGPHLHFEVIQDGEPVDPVRLRGGIEGLLKELRLAADVANNRT